MIPQKSAQQAAIRAAADHLNAGRLAEAEAICQGVLLAAPNQIHALQILGSIALQRGLADTAIEHFRRAVAAAPKDVQARSNLGAALLAKGLAKEAIGFLKAATRTDPNFAPAYVNLGDALMKVDRFADAATALRRAVTLAPFDAKAHTNLGAALTRLKRLDEAAEVLQKAVGLDPWLADAHYNLGGVHGARGDLEKAIASLSKALELQPRFSGAAYHRGILALSLGRFEEGWRDYLNRPSFQDVRLPVRREPLAPDLSGLRLLLGKDQGLGDEIFFLRFAPALKQRGPHITYQVGGKIASLIRRLPFLDVVIDDQEVINPSDWDMILSVGDLPHLLGVNSAAQVPASLQFSVLPDCLAAQSAALAGAGPPPYIGVTWRAGVDLAHSLFKLSPLDRMGAALRGAGGTLIALQRGPEKGEIRRLAKAAGRPVHDFTALNDQLEDMLALLSLLDDYVTVSNTNVHLRAAVGRSSRVLVPHPPEFRWMASGEHSPWFPDSRVYRQDAAGSWDNAFAALEADLRCGEIAET